MTRVPPPRYKVGDKVQIKLAGGEVGKVAEVVPAERPGSCTMYKIRVRTSPDGHFIEVGEERLEKTCLPETGTPSTGKDPMHPTPTRRSEYCYCFTGKHHGGGTSDDARWLPDLSPADEFMVFDTADYYNISSDQGWLYGVLKTASGELRELGTWQQQIAEFPFASSGVPWHGWPLWAVNRFAPSNRADEKMRPSKAVFQQMEKAGLITAHDRKRLSKGDFA